MSGKYDEAFEDAIVKACHEGNVRWLADRLRERLRVNVGLVAENAKFRDQLAGRTPKAGLDDEEERLPYCCSQCGSTLPCTEHPREAMSHG